MSGCKHSAKLCDIVIVVIFQTSSKIALRLHSVSKAMRDLALAVSVCLLLFIQQVTIVSIFRTYVLAVFITLCYPHHICLIIIITSCGAKAQQTPFQCCTSQHCTVCRNWQKINQIVPRSVTPHLLWSGGLSQSCCQRNKTLSFARWQHKKAVIQKSVLASRHRAV